jgi:hypothetical protein
MIPDFTRTYTYPPGTRGQMLVAVCLMGLATVCAAIIFSGAPIVLLFIGLPTLFGIVEFIKSGYSVSISGAGISTSLLGRESRLNWSEICSIKSLSASGDLELQNADNSCSIRIQSQIEGYLELIKQLVDKRPDLWNSNVPETFHRAVGNQLLSGCLGILLMALGIGVVKNEVAVGIFSLVFGSLIWVNLLADTQIITLQEGELVLKSLIREKRLNASAVERIRVDTSERGHSSTRHSVIIKQKNGKRISLNGFKEGPALLHYALQSWWQQNASLLD